MLRQAERNVGRGMTTDLLVGDDSDGEVKFTINNDYASKYEHWRHKEVLQKWKDRQKGGGMDDESSSSEEDDDAKDLPRIEKEFFRTLSFLKKKDPRIYDENTKFFASSSNNIDNPNAYNQTENKKQKDKPFVLRDYERKIILERDGKLSDDDEVAETNPRANSPTYIEEQKALKESFKHALENSDEEENDSGFGKLFKKKEKTEAEQRKEDDEYKEWLKGQKKKLKDKDMESDLKGLRDVWNDPNINSDEAFLRDYILNKRFLGPDDEDFEPAFNEIVHDDCDLDEDDNILKGEEEFEHKYNFRFEEPDPEFIKRYPRSMGNSLRREDNKRKIRRKETRERKEAEKLAKREEIKQLKSLKKKEILAKIEKIKEITGNDDIDFQDEDFEEDFCPEKHDEKMKKLFNEDYYKVEETDKPKCPELERDLEVENWENWQGKDDENQQNSDYDWTKSNVDSWQEPQCEDPNFNMDCDYDPKAELQEELLTMTKSKKKQWRKSKFAEAIARKKPVYDPNNKNFEEYFEEYYKLDCEDIIGDLPCRFKYRKTTPNSYGLTVDEILRADVKELNKWCSLKKVVRYNSDYIESYDVQAYSKKAANEALKKKILPSLYKSSPDDFIEDSTLNPSGENNKKKKKKKKRLNHNEENDVHFKSENLPDDEIEFSENVNNASGTSIDMMKKKKKKKKQKSSDEQDKYSESKNIETRREMQADGETVEENKIVNRKKKKRKYVENENIQQKKDMNNDKKNNKKRRTHVDTIPFSNTRLKAYGINPKKFKNKLTYGNKKNYD